MSEQIKRRGMSGKDVITVGIFSAIYFVINFAFMLLGGLHPLLWILMPGFIALFTGITFTRAAALFGLTELPLWYFGFLLIVALLYMLLTTMVKVFYQKKYRELI